VTYEEFHHRLRILLHLETDEARKEGAFEDQDAEAPKRFEANPFTYFIRAGDSSARRLWSLIQRIAAGDRRPS
jgi:hypothetical protein